MLNVFCVKLCNFSGDDAANLFIKGIQSTSNREKEGKVPYSHKHKHHHNDREEHDEAHDRDLQHHLDQQEHEQEQDVAQDRSDSLPIIFRETKRTASNSGGGFNRQFNSLEVTTEQATAIQTSRKKETVALRVTYIPRPRAAVNTSPPPGTTLNTVSH